MDSGKEKLDIPLPRFPPLSIPLNGFTGLVAIGRRKPKMYLSIPLNGF